jgi:hypothetical protein
MPHEVSKDAVRHPIWERAMKDRPFDLRADCPFCGVSPGKPCILSTTHVARHERALELEREEKLPPLKTVNDLPEYIKKDLVLYCKCANIEPSELHSTSAIKLLRYWCSQMDFIDVIKVIDAIEEVKG